MNDDEFGVFSGANAGEHKADASTNLAVLDVDFHELFVDVDALPRMIYFLNRNLRHEKFIEIGKGF